MNRRTDLELALDGYLADHGERLPDRVLEDALTEIDHTAQRRSPTLAWRFTPMSATLRLGLVAAALIVAALGGIYLIGSRPSPNVAASPTPASPSPTAQSVSPGGSASGNGGPAMTQFESPLYGYTVQAPSAYQFIPATRPWPAGEALGPETEWTDRYRAGTNFVGIASQPIPAGTSSEQWLEAYMQTVEKRECGAPATQWTDLTYQGIAGKTLSFDCGGSPGLEYAWTIGDRGWVLTGDPAVAQLMLPALNIP
jgi:hypothetical protein